MKKHNFNPDMIVLCEEPLSENQMLEIAKICIENNTNVGVFNLDKKLSCYAFFRNGEVSFRNSFDYDDIDCEINYNKFISVLKGELFLDQNHIKVNLNLSFDALVKKDIVTVGCQKFKHEAIENLYQAIQMVKKGVI